MCSPGCAGAYCLTSAIGSSYNVNPNTSAVYTPTATGKKVQRTVFTTGNAGHLYTTLRVTTQSLLKFLSGNRFVFILWTFFKTLLQKTGLSEFIWLNCSFMALSVTHCSTSLLAPFVWYYLGESMQGMLWALFTHILYYLIIVLRVHFDLFRKLQLLFNTL